MDREKAQKIVDEIDAVLRKYDAHLDGEYGHSLPTLWDGRRAESFEAIVPNTSEGYIIVTAKEAGFS